ncbi:unnamed protein product [Peniophora sp. CBMAI 1063]|nr:unnamed protein product [Peniophora sp. CBMAI 1063]
MNIDHLPGDLLLEIASHLRLPSEILHLSLTSRHVFGQLAQVLYAEVKLRGSIQCIQTLKMLVAHPERARHIRSLCLHPDDHGPFAARIWGRGALFNGYAISGAIRRLASKMEILQSFMWDGEELPPYDDMWFALRVFCPRLKFIGTSVGSILTSPNSHLFDFRDLHGFSLIFKPGFFAHMEPGSRDEAIPGYKRLWCMLINHCPNLEELTIDGYSPAEPVDAHRLTRGRWPYLRKLVLGDVVTEWHTALNHAARRSFLTFLEQHRNLEILHLHSGQMSVGSPSILDDLHDGALPNVRDFGGSLAQLQAYAHRAKVHTLRLPDAILLRESSPLTVSAVLVTAPQLTSLTISFALPHGYDNGGIVRSIASACPMLEHLDFTCACRPAFKFDTFSRSIKPLGRLRSLQLSIVRARGEETLVTCGSQLVRANPRISNFTISFLERSGPSPTRGSPPTIIRSASFDLLTDQHGLPVQLRVREKSRPLLWWRQPTATTQLVDMRPPGYPGTLKGGVVALLLDPSPAGQEMRVICLCAALVLSTVGGCFLL